MNLFFLLLLANEIHARSKSVVSSKSGNTKNIDDLPTFARSKSDVYSKSDARSKSVAPSKSEARSKSVARLKSDARSKSVSRSKSRDKKESIALLQSDASLSCLTLEKFNSIYLKGLEISKFEDAVTDANLLGVGGTSVVYRLKMNIEKLNKIETVTVAAKILNNGDISDKQFYDEIEKMNTAQIDFVGCVPKLYTCIYETQENNPLINEQQQGQRNTKFKIAKQLRVIIMESSLGDFGLSNLKSKPLLAYDSISLSAKLYLF